MGPVSCTFGQQSHVPLDHKLSIPSHVDMSSRYTDMQVCLYGYLGKGELPTNEAPNFFFPRISLPPYTQTFLLPFRDVGLPRPSADAAQGPPRLPHHQRVRRLHLPPLALAVAPPEPPGT